MGDGIRYKLTDQHEAVMSSWKKFEKNQTSDWGLSGVDTGHHWLNMITGGWLPGKVTTIAARSSIGKTATVTQMLNSGSRVLQGRRPEYLLFTWEMSPDYLVDRHVSMEVGLTIRQLTQGARLLSDSTIESVKKAYKSADKLPIQYQQMSLNINEVVSITQKFAKKCNEKSEVEGIVVQPVVIIDFIGMAQFDKSGPRTYGISEFIYGCKQAATQTGASFCIFSQINRTSDMKDKPSRSDISDSQSIEQASDNLIILHRPEHHKIPTMRDPHTGQEMSSEGKMLVLVEKCRDSDMKDEVINCDVGFNRFWSEGMKWDEPYWLLYESGEFWIEHFGLSGSRQLKVV